VTPRTEDSARPVQQKTETAARKIRAEIENTEQEPEHLAGESQASNGQTRGALAPRDFRSRQRETEPDRRELGVQTGRTTKADGGQLLAARSCCRKSTTEGHGHFDLVPRQDGEPE
jgi:hypothetical protein